MAGFGFGSGIGRAFVEDHDDVGTQRTLHGHGFFRPQKHHATVHWRLEFHAGFVDFADRRQAEYLKTARIGQDRSVPVHEAVQATVLFDDGRAGPQHQVKGITENDFGTAGA